MHNLKHKLEYDIRGEEKAIRDYGQRIKQAKGSGIVDDLEEIHTDEKDHKRRLQRALKGLKDVKE